MAAGGLEVNGFKYREMEKRLCRPEKKKRRDEEGENCPLPAFEPSNRKGDKAKSNFPGPHRLSPLGFQKTERGE